MIEKNIKLRCIKELKGCSFTFGMVYDCCPYKDEFLNGYSIFDDGEEWYYYSKKFVKENFEIVQEKGC